MFCFFFFTARRSGRNDRFFLTSSRWYGESGNFEFKLKCYQSDNYTEIDLFFMFLVLSQQWDLLG